MNALSRFNNYPTIKTDGSVFTFGPVVNLKSAGTRTITASASTGVQPGDSALSVPGPIWLTGIQSAGSTISSDIVQESPSVWPTVTIEIYTDQGVVAP